VKVVRFHTRVPVVDPQAVTPERVAALTASGKTVWVALHANHPRELTPAARAACARMIDAGAAMISQTVLLKGVNDDPEVLGELMRGFVETRIKPYYLHHGDLAPGTSHLRTTLAEGQAVMRAMRGRWSACASRPMCSTSPAATARSRWACLPGGGRRHGGGPVGAAARLSALGRSGGWLKLLHDFNG
jgi:lysine 2,3-aminomutase